MLIIDILALTTLLQEGSMKQKHKRFIRGILQTLRLEKPLRSVYRRWKQYNLYRKYGNLSQVEIEVEGVKVLFSTEDLYSKRHLLSNTEDIYEAHITHLITQRMTTCKCFVDVGAHIGYYTCIAAKLSPDARIYAFEMDRQNFELLQKNITLNQVQNIEAHQAAVTNSNDEAWYIKETDSPSSGFELSNNVESDSHFGILVSVEGISLDSFFSKKTVLPDLIKIDVEGAELQVLEGMRQLLQTTNPQLFLEIHPEKILNFNATVAQVLELLFSCGYEVYEHEKMKSDSVKRLSPNSPVLQNNVLHAWKP